MTVANRAAAVVVVVVLVDALAISYREQRRTYFIVLYRKTSFRVTIVVKL